MMFDNINATNFGYSSSFYINEFEDILRGIIVCYNCIISSEVALPNNENEIRDEMLKDYLKVDLFKKSHFNLASYHFDYETIENTGRADIRILPINPYINDEAYYIIECKRLNNQNLSGKTGLNAEYVKNGICRFVIEHYSSYYGINGMIGFVVDDLITKTNIENLNSFLNQNLINDKGITVNANSIQQISSIGLNENFKYSYISKHLSCNQKEIVLYHLMFDFSKNINHESN
ncbi:MAG: hypothetical protein CVU02_01035 [Bacteroidetes bacterium HGW-Bacteroidetes-19]|nr:MAG: hypothetical protein CVU02_01035 [Bacteroidetes bacterium HGW-Bacteroidetes-19]